MNWGVNFFFDSYKSSQGFYSTGPLAVGNNGISSSRRAQASCAPRVALLTRHGRVDLGTDTGAHC